MTNKLHIISKNEHVFVKKKILESLTLSYAAKGFYAYLCIGEVSFKIKEKNKISSEIEMEIYQAFSELVSHKILKYDEKKEIYEFDN